MRAVSPCTVRLLFFGLNENFLSKICVHVLTTFLWYQVPASVRVRRETAIQKSKPKPQQASVGTAPRPSSAPVTIGKSESAAQPSAPKPQSIDDSYMAFLEDMKALGALDS